MLKKSLILCIAVATSFTSLGQTVMVKDKTTRRPISMVNVASYGSSTVAVTNDGGEADLSSFKSSSNDSIVFSLVGYETKAFRIDSIAPDDRFTVYLDRSPFALDAVVISAAKWEQAKRDVPVKVVSILPEDVELQAPQTSADMLARSGEVYVQKSQLGGGSPMIRGLSANRVMLSVDGIRMNNAIFRGGNLQNVLSIDALSIERSEVIFGPGSVIYGSDALGGVMSFYTLEPKFSTGDGVKTEGSVLLRTASANFEKTGHFDLSISGKRWASATSVTYSDFDDLRMGSNGPREYLRPEYVERVDGTDSVLSNPDRKVQKFSGYEQLNVLQKIRFKASEKVDVGYTFLYSTTSDYARYDRLIRYRDGLPRSAEWYYGPQDWMMHALKVESADSNFFYDRARITMAYQQFKESRHDRDYKDDILTSREEQVDAISLNFDLEQDIGARHEIFYGTELILNDVSSTASQRDIVSGSTTEAPTRYPNGAYWNSAAIYLNDRFRATERITLLGGLRYSFVQLSAPFDTIFYDLPTTEASLAQGALNGSLGLTYRPSEDWQFNVNLATGFRAPNIDDIGKVFDSEPGAVIVPNPSLLPEYAYNADVGISKVFGDALRFDVNGFYTLLENAMVRREFVLDGQDSIIYDGELSRVQAIQNAASAFVYGFSAGLEWKIGANISLMSRLSYQVGKEELDDGTLAPLRHAAPAFGVTRITCSRDRLRLQLGTQYNAEVSADEMPPSEIAKGFMYAGDESFRPYSPAWYIVNFRALYSVNDNVQFTGGVENILDLRYRTYSSGISAPGRNFQASVRVLF